MPIVAESIVSLYTREKIWNVPVGVLKPGLPVVAGMPRTGVSPSIAVTHWRLRFTSTQWMPGGTVSGRVTCGSTGLGGGGGAGLGGGATSGWNAVLILGSLPVGSNRPASRAISPTSATVTSPADAHGTSC